MGRRGLPGALPGGRRVWINAASVGETMAAIPFVEAWRRRHPDDVLLVTNTTVTGFNRADEKLAAHIAWHGYSPIDTPVAVRRYIAALKPDIYITVEAEAWPNLLFELGRAGAPRILVNGRMTLANKHGLKRRITAEIWKLFDSIIARSKRDYAAYRELGISDSKLAVGGELKCDIEFPAMDAAEFAAFRELYSVDAERCWIAASTHEGEDELAIDAHRAALACDPSARLVLVPRRPERFDAVAAILDASGLKYTRASEGAADATAQVLLVDAMGLLLKFYQACGLAVVCGSFYGPGVHSVLEPAAYGKPIVCGHRVFNTDIPERMQADAMLAVLAEPELLKQAVVAWIKGECAPGTSYAFDEMGERAAKFLTQNRGAAERTVAHIEELLAKRAMAGKLTV
jgi:3-deoxy-D-manno-octulosonic-acid transferase